MSGEARQSRLFLTTAAAATATTTPPLPPHHCDEYAVELSRVGLIVPGARACVLPLAIMLLLLLAGCCLVD